MTDSPATAEGQPDHSYIHNNTKGDYLKRLRRIEGQARGLQRMVEEEQYCIDILTQVTAIQSALTAFNKELLADHIHTCVVDDVRAGKEEALDELVTTLQKLVK